MSNMSQIHQRICKNDIVKTVLQNLQKYTEKLRVCDLALEDMHWDGDVTTSIYHHVKHESNPSKASQKLTL